MLLPTQGSQLVWGFESLPYLIGVRVDNNHALIWHALRLAGIGDAIRGFGLLYGLSP